MHSLIKTASRALGLLALVSASTLSAQQHYGSDDFNSGVLGIPSSNWDYSFRLSGSVTDSLLEVASNRLEFTKGAGAGSYFIGWNNDASTGTLGSLLAASYTDSWVMNMTVTNTLGLTGGDFATIGFQVTDSSDNYYAQMLSSTGSGNYFRTEWDNGASSVNPTATDVTDVFLRIGWDAGSQTLSSHYSIDGSTYTQAGTYNPVGIWNANLSNGFWFEVFGNSNIAASITSGSMYADNFSVSAVPEPSTYAAIFGGLMLGFAVWRRRKSA